MEEKTKNDSNVEQTPRKTPQERMADIIIDGLERAKANGGIFMNASQKVSPAILNSKMQQSPFNKALIALNSDRNGYKTNLVTFFSSAKERGESILKGEKGMPISWYSWNHYEKKDDPSITISQSDYEAMHPKEKDEYQAVRNKETRLVFNIDQTTMPSVNEERYGKTLKEHGTLEDRGVEENEDSKLRIAVNSYILNVRDNLVPIVKDGGGMSYYDKDADRCVIAESGIYNSYSDYVQDMTRNVVEATAHPQRLNRHSSKNYAVLVTEIASAVKQMEFCLPAKLSPVAMENIDNMIDMLKKNPSLVEGIEKDVNSSLYMIQKAHRGEKVEKRQQKTTLENWRANLPKEGTVPDMIVAVMKKGLDDKWTLFVMPEREKVFAVHPTNEDISLYFNIMKGTVVDDKESFRKELGQKYYAEAEQNPDIKVDVFGEKMNIPEKDAIEKVLVFKSKDIPAKIYITPTLTTGEKLKARQMTQDQWQMLWLAPDMKDFKKVLAATIFKEEIDQKMNISQDQTNEKKEVMKNEEGQNEPVTLDIPKWSLNYIINGDAKGLTDEEQKVVDDFLDKNFADGFIPELVEGSDKELNLSPAFGLRNPHALPEHRESSYEAVDTAQVKFHSAGYMEILTKEKEKEMKTEVELDKLLDLAQKVKSEGEGITFRNKDTGAEWKVFGVSQKGTDNKDKFAIWNNEISSVSGHSEGLRGNGWTAEGIKDFLKREVLKRWDSNGQSWEAERVKATSEQMKVMNPGKKETKVALSPMVKQFLDLKKKHPASLLLFRCGDFYETYQKDAEKAAKILGITLTRSSKTKDQDGKPLAMAGFPYHALDTYLPRLIRAGERVAICDQIEAPKQTVKRGITELLTPQKNEEQKIEDTKQQADEQEQTRSRGFHR